MNVINYFFLLITLIYHASTYSCDSQLNHKGNDRLQRECNIQNRYLKLSDTFQSYGKDISNVVEYRALRFIDRWSWEKNILKKSSNPRFIYKPAPLTWDIWNNGITTIIEDSAVNIENLLYDSTKLRNINKQMLSDKKNDISYGHHKVSGNLRYSLFDANVGFCSQKKYEHIHKNLSNIEKSFKVYMIKWEKAAGITFRNLVKMYKGPSYRKANLVISLKVIKDGCHNEKGNFITYTKATKVKKYLKWLAIFVEFNIKKYKAGNAIIPPIELSSFVQKIIVSVHPFEDGNGRTSRAIQDLMSKKFKMPYIPAGDLQNDVMQNLDKYINYTYLRTEKMLDFLDGCANDLLKRNLQNLRCEFYNEI